MMKKMIAKRISYAFTYVTTILLIRLTFPLVLPNIKTTGKVDLGFVVITREWVFILSVIIFSLLAFVIYSGLSSIIDKKMK